MEATVMITVCLYHFAYWLILNRFSQFLTMKSKGSYSTCITRLPNIPSRRQFCFCSPSFNARKMYASALYHHESTNLSNTVHISSLFALSVMFLIPTVLLTVLPHPRLLQRDTLRSRQRTMDAGTFQHMVVPPDSDVAHTTSRHEPVRWLLCDCFPGISPCYAIEY